MMLRHLIRLYPRAWRARYGDEFREIIGARRASSRAVIDLVAGAIDAWLQPQPIVASSRVQDTAMVPTLMKRCAAGSIGNTREHAIGATVMFGTTVALTAVYLYLAARYRGNDLVDAFGVLLYPALLMLAMPFTSTREKSRRARLVATAAALTILAVAWFVAKLI